MSEEAGGGRLRRGVRKTLSSTLREMEAFAGVEQGGHMIWLMF